MKNSQLSNMLLKVGCLFGEVFGWQNLILWSDLTLLNTNISKKSTFA